MKDLLKILLYLLLVVGAYNEAGPITALAIGLFLYEIAVLGYIVSICTESLQNIKVLTDEEDESN